MIMELILILIVIAIYFLPSIIANSRQHKNSMAIFVTNLFLGWTFLGWVVSLVWACTSNGYGVGDIVIESNGDTP